MCNHEYLEPGECPDCAHEWREHKRTQKAICLFRRWWLVIDWRYPKMLIWISRDGSVLNAFWIKGSYWDWAIQHGGPVR